MSAEVIKVSWSQIKDDLFWLQLPYIKDGNPIPVKIDARSAEFLLKNKTHDIRFIGEAKKGAVWVIYPITPPELNIKYQKDLEAL